MVGGTIRVGSLTIRVFRTCGALDDRVAALFRYIVEGASLRSRDCRFVGTETIGDSRFWTTRSRIADGWAFGGFVSTFIRCTVVDTNWSNNRSIRTSYFKLWFCSARRDIASAFDDGVPTFSFRRQVGTRTWSSDCSTRANKVGLTRWWTTRRGVTYGTGENIPCTTLCRVAVNALEAVQGSDDIRAERNWRWRTATCTIAAWSSPSCQKMHLNSQHSCEACQQLHDPCVDVFLPRRARFQEARQKCQQSSRHFSSLRF